MRVYVLVEGQTEEAFVSRVLSPYFWDNEIYLTPVILGTKRSKSGEKFKGGNVNFQKLEKEILQLLSSGPVTTMIDYYGLNDDFPNYKESLALKSCGEKALHIEDYLRKTINNKNFIPYIQMHEFEALLFSDVSSFEVVDTDYKRVEKLNEEIAQFDSPEEVNNCVETAPSKRIQAIFVGYKKTVDGIMIAEKIGIEKMKGKCLHFSEWVDKLNRVKEIN